MNWILKNKKLRHTDIADHAVDLLNKETQEKAVSPEHDELVMFMDKNCKKLTKNKRRTNGINNIDM